MPAEATCSRCRTATAISTPPPEHLPLLTHGETQHFKTCAALQTVCSRFTVKKVPVAARGTPTAGPNATDCPVER